MRLSDCLIDNDDDNDDDDDPEEAGAAEGEGGGGWIARNIYLNRLLCWNLKT